MKFATRDGTVRQTGLDTVRLLSLLRDQRDGTTTAATGAARIMPHTLDVKVGVLARFRTGTLTRYRETHIPIVNIRVENANCSTRGR